MSCMLSHVLQPSQYSASSFSSTFLIMISSPPASPLFNHNKKTKNKSWAFTDSFQISNTPTKAVVYTGITFTVPWHSNGLRAPSCSRQTACAPPPLNKGWHRSQSKALHTPSAPGNCATLHHFFCLWSQWNNYVLSFGGIQVQTEGSSKRSFPTERQCCSPRDTGLTGSTNLKVNNPPESHGKYKK